MQRDRHSITMTPLELDERIAAARSDLEARLAAAKADLEAANGRWYTLRNWGLGSALCAPPSLTDIERVIRRLEGKE